VKKRQIVRNDFMLMQKYRYKALHCKNKERVLNSKEIFTKI